LGEQGLELGDLRFCRLQQNVLQRVIRREGLGHLLGLDQAGPSGLGRLDHSGEVPSRRHLVHLLHPDGDLLEGGDGALRSGLP